MADYYENKSSPEQGGAEQNQQQEHAQGANAYNPGQDPYRTTGGNAGTGWQAGAPYGGRQSQGGWNGQNGWNGRQEGRRYVPNYQNAYQGGRPPYGEEYKWDFAQYEKVDAAQKKKRHKGLMVFTGIVCSMFAVAVVVFAGFGVYQLVQGPPASSPGTSQGGGAAIAVPQLDLNEVPSEADIIAADGKLTPKQIAAKVRPSVVGVVAYIPATSSNYGLGGAMQQSEGSGIIMNSDGYIITNAHVVAGARGDKVVLNHDEEYEAKLVGLDSNTDLAVLKIEAGNLTPAEFGDSSSLEVGEYVAAIGNPGGLMLSNSMTQGIISGINRPINSSGGYTMNYIQTDAAINPGNSGGALVNEYGQVVGINTVKIAATDYEGLGFAIPISDAKPIIDDLIANGYVTGRVRLGITGREIDDTLARYNNVPSGFFIYSCDEGSDIAAKGVIAGDIITKIDGNSVSSSNSIQDYLKDFKPGDQVTLTIFRRTSGRKDTTFEVSVALMEDTGDAKNTQQQVRPQESGNHFSILQ